MSAPDDPEIRTGGGSHDQERLLRFETAEEFQTRPCYKANIDPNLDKPTKIFGGYGFKREKYILCGLVSCKRLHGAGFNVKTALGYETNIGHCCGKTRFGAEWVAMEASFQRQTHLQALHDVLTTAVQRRKTTLDAALRIMPLVEEAHALVASIMMGINADRPLAKVFESCRRDRGSLVYFRKLTEDERALSPGQTTVRTLVGHIDGVNATSENPKLIRELRFKIVEPLNDFSEQDLKQLPLKDLEKKSLEFGAMGGLLQRAELFCEDAKKLARPQNWRSFEEFCDASKVNVSGSARKMLRALAAKTAQP